jgi:hypothetical protein
MSVFDEADIDGNKISYSKNRGRVEFFEGDVGKSTLTPVSKMPSKENHR